MWQFIIKPKATATAAAVAILTDIGLPESLPVLRRVNRVLLLCYVEIRDVLDDLYRSKTNVN